MTKQEFIGWWLDRARPQVREMYKDVKQARVACMVATLADEQSKAEKFWRKHGKWLRTETVSKFAERVAKHQGAA